jgi:hypothetical protein
MQPKQPHPRRSHSISGINRNHLRKKTIGKPARSRSGKLNSTGNVAYRKSKSSVHNKSGSDGREKNKNVAHGKNRSG